jgi:EAL domain-containing protein (putative c-di-GMP-specific phosphodiesterase class I)
MSFGRLQAPQSSFSVGERAASSLLGLFESLPGVAAGAVIAGFLAVTLAFPQFGALAPLLPLWLVVPIVLAAIRFRSLGALVTAAIALVLAGPLAPFHPGPLQADDVAEWIAASLAFVALGQFVAVAVHQPRGARREALESMQAERTLRRGLAAGRFEVHYQPIVAIAGPRDYIASAEALLRWREPVTPGVAPIELLAVAERSGVIRELSQFVLDQACERIAEWSALLPRPFVIWVNLSASELADDTLATRIRNAIARNHIDPWQLGLEITETAVMHDIRPSSELLRRVHNLGVRIAIDDFGTGQSSLEYIRFLPVDVIKIDGSFVEGLPDDPISTKLVSTVVDLAHAMGLQTVGEQVETGKQLGALRDMGCDYAQGFYFSPAVASEVVDEWLRGRHDGPVQAPKRAVAHPARLARRAEQSNEAARTQLHHSGTADTSP